MNNEPSTSTGDWLLLIHQLPAKPAYLRVKIWRRLQTIGAAPVKNAVYALPASEKASLAFRQVLREIVDGGGDALVCRASLDDGLSDIDMRALFDAARDADYDEVASDARTLLAGDAVTIGEVERLRKRRAEIAAIDFFGAHGREALDALLLDLQNKLQQHPQIDRSDDDERPRPEFRELRDRIWVTRRGVHVDRIASAWFVLRFVDESASFKFVDGKGYKPEEGELRFDMAEAEFTHEGDLCTFEVLLAYAQLETDLALKAIAEIIHDIDIRDEKFGRAETAGVKALIAGVCTTGDDDERIARGSAVFDELYAHFRKSRGA